MLRLRLRVYFELLVDLLFLVALAWDFEEDFFFTPFVGTASARPGDKVNAKEINAVQIIRFAIQNLLWLRDNPERELSTLISPGQFAGIHHHADKERIAIGIYTYAKIGKSAYSVSATLL